LSRFLNKVDVTTRGFRAPVPITMLSHVFHIVFTEFYILLTQFSHSFFLHDISNGFDKVSGFQNTVPLDFTWFGREREQVGGSSFDGGGGSG